MASWMVLAATVVSTPLALTAAPPEPPSSALARAWPTRPSSREPASAPTPQATPQAPPQPQRRPAATVESSRRSGSILRINGLSQRAAWLWVGEAAGGPRELWLPLEVLEGQLGVSRRTKTDGTLDLEWFGQGLLVPPAAQRSLEDEVAVDVAALLRKTGVHVAPVGADGLDLQLPAPRLLQVRDGKQPGVRRVVLDLDAPAIVRRDSNALLLALRSDPAQRARLAALGLSARQAGEALTLSGATPTKILTLGTPARVVIDLPAAAAGESATGPAPIDPRLRALLGPQLRWDRQVKAVGGDRMLINSVQLDPRSSPLELKPLSRPDGMEGLSSLVQLARYQDALVAINGGFFNRTRRLPLGALKNGGRWLSGPILNRGVVAWEPRSLPRFGRLRLEEWVSDARGTRWPVLFVNSGYVQRGVSRYTADWGRVYRPLSGSEMGLLVRDGVVRQRFEGAAMARGIPIGPADTLLVGRAGVVLPWREGEALTITSRPSDAVGTASYVLGGGPLLLLNGQVVLNGAAEGFSPSFMKQGAPRTVIGSDGNRLWLITLEGVDQAGPTLGETAVLLRQMGLRDALNLDGGSSTGLVMGGSHTVKGRGVAASVHNGLGLVPVGAPGGGRGDS